MPEYVELARVTDMLRWDCVLKGKMVPKWGEGVEPMLVESPLPPKIRKTGKDLGQQAAMCDT